MRSWRRAQGADRGPTLQEPAEALAVNDQTIGYLERGEDNPSLELALRIAEHFGLPVEAIFSRTPSCRCHSSCIPIGRR